LITGINVLMLRYVSGHQCSGGNHSDSRCSVSCYSDKLRPTA